MSVHTILAVPKIIWYSTNRQEGSHAIPATRHEIPAGFQKLFNFVFSNLNGGLYEKIELWNQFRSYVPYSSGCVFSLPFWRFYDWQTCTGMWGSNQGWSFCEVSPWTVSDLYRIYVRINQTGGRVFGKRKNTGHRQREWMGNTRPNIHRQRTKAARLFLSCVWFITVKRCFQRFITTTESITHFNDKSTIRPPETWKGISW